MRVIIQRVSKAQVISDGILTGQINQGLLLLLGIHPDDTEKDIQWLIHKIIQMRIFSDENGKMNLSVKDIHGGILVVSQFTLFASSKKGNRPSFINAAAPPVAVPLYNQFLDTVKKSGFDVQAGIFGADMKIELVNDGPVTIIIDSQHPE